LVGLPRLAQRGPARVEPAQDAALETTSA
jgi:hypothetical protein